MRNKSRGRGRSYGGGGGGYSGDVANQWLGVFAVITLIVIFVFWKFILIAISVIVLILVLLFILVAVFNNCEIESDDLPGKPLPGKPYESNKKIEYEYRSEDMVIIKRIYDENSVCALSKQKENKTGSTEEISQSDSVDSVIKEESINTVEVSKVDEVVEHAEEVAAVEVDEAVDSVEVDEVDEHVEEATTVEVDEVVDPVEVGETVQQSSQLKHSNCIDVVEVNLAETEAVEVVEIVEARNTNEIDEVIDEVDVADNNLDKAVRHDTAITIQEAFKKSEIICMICGKGRIRNLNRHLNVVHNMKSAEYRELFHISIRQPFVTKGYSEGKKKSLEKKSLANSNSQSRNS